MSESQMPTGYQLMFQYLGASVLLCWNELPWQMQELILNQAKVPSVSCRYRRFLIRSHCF